MKLHLKLTMFDLMHILEVYICFINSKQAILSIWWKFIFYLLSSRVLEIILKHFTYNFIFVCYLFGIGKGRLELKLKKAKFLFWIWPYLSVDWYIYVTVPQSLLLKCYILVILHSVFLWCYSILIFPGTVYTPLNQRTHFHSYEAYMLTEKEHTYKYILYQNL